jgi:hypothetical protein
MIHLFLKSNPNDIFGEIDHTGVYKWVPAKIDVCLIFRMAYTYEKDGRRIRRFFTDFSSN